MNKAQSLLVLVFSSFVVGCAPSGSTKPAVADSVAQGGTRSETPTDGGASWLLAPLDEAPPQRPDDVASKPRAAAPRVSELDSGGPDGALAVAVDAGNTQRVALVARADAGPEQDGALPAETDAPEPDAGTVACECSTTVNAGPCCDGCHFRAPSYFCGEVTRSSTCVAWPNVALRCSGTGGVSEDRWNLFCSGVDGRCSRWGAHVATRQHACATGTECSGTADAGSCGACP